MIFLSMKMTTGPWLVELMNSKNDNENGATADVTLAYEDDKDIGDNTHIQYMETVPSIFLIRKSTK